MCSSIGHSRNAGGGGVGCDANRVVIEGLIEKMGFDQILKEERKPAMMPEGVVNEKVGACLLHMVRVWGQLHNYLLTK